VRLLLRSILTVLTHLTVRPLFVSDSVVLLLSEPT